MKKRILAIALLSGFALTGCQSDTPPESVSQTDSVTGTVAVDINDTAKITDTVNSVKTKAPDSESEKIQWALNQREGWMPGCVYRENLGYAEASHIADRIVNSVFYEYAYRHNGEMPDGNSDNIMKLAEEYYGIDNSQRLINSLYYSDTESKFIWNDDLQIYNLWDNLTLIKYSVSDGFYKALVKIENYSRLVCFTFSFDGDNINLTDIRYSYYNLITSLTDNDRNVCLMYDSNTKDYVVSVINSKITEMSVNIPDYNLTSDFYTLYANEKSNIVNGEIIDNQAIFTSEDGKQSLTVNLKNGEYSVRMDYTYDDVIGKIRRETTENSPKHGDEYLACALAGSGGDIWMDDLWLLNDKLKTVHFLGTVGGMYGGGSDYGFFKNGDVYTIGNYSFHEFRNGKIYFALEDVFYLGDYDDDGYRRVNAVRRNEDMTYTVLYSDVEDGFTYSDADGYYTDRFYKIAVMTADDKIIKSVTTDVPIYFNDFGLNPCNMYKKSDSEIDFTITFKSSLFATVTVNLDTGKTTANYNQ